MVAALVTIPLAGCIPLGGANPSEDFPRPTDELNTILEFDDNELDSLLQATLDDRLTEIGAIWARTDALVDADLDAAAVAVVDTATDPDASGTASLNSAPSIRLAAARPLPSATPGLDLPIVREGGETTTGELEGRPMTTTTSSSTRIENQTEISTDTATTTVGDPSAGTGVSESMSFGSEQVACAPDKEVSGSFEAEQVRTVAGGGDTIELRSTVEGRFSRNADGTFALTEVTSRVTATTIHADGTTTPGRSITTRFDVPSWNTARPISSSKGMFAVVDAPESVSREDALSAGVMLALIFEPQIKKATERAQQLRNEKGLCVRLQVDTHGVTDLAEGDTAPFTVWAIDVGTGKDIAEAPLDAGSWKSTVVPEQSVGRTQFEITAVGDPDYFAAVETTTARGGHSVVINWGAHGWRFEGVTYSYTIPSHLGPIPATATWSGEVCGDVTDEWDVVAQISSEFGSPVVALPMTPYPIDRIPEGNHAYLVYELREPKEGEPPFRLWVDEHNSEIIPTDHRVEIHPEPVEMACVSG